MFKEPLVSIIINCFNGEKYLREAIDSVISQTYKNWEVIFWDNQSTDRSARIFKNYKDERLKYFGKKLLYMEKPESLSKSDYNLIHKDTAKKLLSTNNEKWNTIPRTYSEIDTLRAKFEKQGEPEKLEILDEINAYVEELEKHYSSA